MHVHFFYDMICVIRHGASKSHRWKTLYSNTHSISLRKLKSINIASITVTEVRPSEKGQELAVNHFFAQRRRERNYHRASVKQMQEPNVCEREGRDRSCCMSTAHYHGDCRRCRERVERATVRHVIAFKTATLCFRVSTGFPSSKRFHRCRRRWRRPQSTSTSTNHWTSSGMAPLVLFAKSGGSKTARCAQITFHLPGRAWYR